MCCTWRTRLCNISILCTTRNPLQIIRCLSPNGHHAAKASYLNCTLQKYKQFVQHLMKGELGYAYKRLKYILHMTMWSMLKYTILYSVLCKSIYSCLDKWRTWLCYCMRQTWVSISLRERGHSNSTLGEHFKRLTLHMRTHSLVNQTIGHWTGILNKRASILWRGWGNISQIISDFLHHKASFADWPPKMR